MVDFDHFLSLSGDLNPLHMDASFARSQGFRDRVFYGLGTSALLSKLVGVYLPGRRALLQGVEVTYHNPVFEGDILTVFGEISEVHQVLKFIRVSAKITNQSGVKISKAAIQVGVR
jgi:acyl dehydratase